MAFSRHNPALAAMAVLSFLASGCWLDHGHDPVPDASRPPPADAGDECAVEAVEIQIVECPPSTVFAGTDVGVQVHHGVGGCCAASDGRVSVRHDGREHTLTSEWTVCSCCDECECVGPHETERVSLGVLEPGTHTVRAGASTCTFQVEEAACVPLTADEVRAPTVLFPDQPMAASARVLSSPGCSCTPQMTDVPGGAALSVCNCCLDCLCVDPGLEAGWTDDPLPLGEHTLEIARREVTVSVVERASCQPRTATGLEIVGPEPALTQAGERLWWAVVSGTEVVCCVDPAPAIEHERSGSGFDLSLHSCLTVDCDCIGSPVDYSAWHSLGELAPGTYTVRIDGFAETFTVP